MDSSYICTKYTACLSPGPVQQIKPYLYFAGTAAQSLELLAGCMQHSKLTLTLLTWTKWWAPASASKWRMGFNSAFKGLIIYYK
jgi:hypothetical protein